MTRAGWLLGVLVVFSATAARGEDFSDIDPLGTVIAYMEVAGEGLGQTVTDEPTQKPQRAVVAKLDDLIAKLEKECEACRGGSTSGANPNRPLADSRVIGGPGGSGDLHAPQRDGRDWAALPPHERDRILQSMNEGFPAHYQLILERYYRRLAEEKPAAELGSGEEGAANADATTTEAEAPESTESK